MTPFNKILVPVDFTVHSAQAVHRAADLAKRYAGAELTLVYVYDPGDYPVPEGFVFYTPEQLARVTAEFQRRLDAARSDAEAPGVSVSTRLLQGSAAQQIIELARDEGFDLIVMGTHGRTGVGRWVMGSVAEKVVRSAPCAVLTVKASAAQG